jgi:hypothetical protein
MFLYITLQKVGQKYLESLEIRCWGRMQNISWTDNVGNEEVLQTIKEGNILQTAKRRKVNWYGHILHRNCLLKHIIEGKIEGRIEVMEDQEEGVRSYWMTLRKREDTGN